MTQTRFLSRRFDEAAILASLAKIAFAPDPHLTEQDFAALAALRRSSPDWDLTLEETAERLAGYSDEQIAGLVNNVKGILHEMEFVRIENQDGDSVFATIFPDTNQRSVDVQMFDRENGDAWAIQLKATDDISAINAWSESNPDTEIFVTEEIADHMGLPQSGFSNEELTVSVESFVDRLVKMEEDGDQTLWEACPHLVAASSGIVVFELWRRYRKGELSSGRFRFMTLKVLGLKAGKYAALFSALSVPGINVAVGAYLLGSFVMSVTQVVDDSPSYKPFAKGLRKDDFRNFYK